MTLQIASTFPEQCVVILKKIIFPTSKMVVLLVLPCSKDVSSARSNLREPNAQIVMIRTDMPFLIVESAAV